MKVTYVFDAYCGWCYGFGPAVTELAAQEWVDLQVIGGSLFPRRAFAAIGNFPHIPAANARIAELTGVAFGPAYEQVLKQGQFVMDSDAAAVGLSALKAAGGPELAMARAMQDAFYQDGLSLGAVDTYRGIAAAAGLDVDAVLFNLTDPAVTAAAHAEQSEAAALGVNSYPTLLAHVHGGLRRFGGPVTSGADLVELARGISRRYDQPGAAVRPRPRN